MPFGQISVLESKTTDIVNSLHNFPIKILLQPTLNKTRIISGKHTKLQAAETKQCCQVMRIRRNSLICSQYKTSKTDEMISFDQTLDKTAV